MKINDWHVMKSVYTDNNKTSYFYGDLSEFEPEDYALLVEAPIGEWAKEDFVEILGNMLEDDNRHTLITLPNLLVDIMCKSNISEEHQLLMMRNLTEHYSEKHSLKYNK